MTEAFGSPRTKPPVVVHLPKRAVPPPIEEQPAPKRPSVIFKERPTPIAFAQFWLKGRVSERNGQYLLDGRPTNFELIMRVANRAAKAGGQEMLASNPRWVPA